MTPTPTHATAAPASRDAAPRASVSVVIPCYRCGATIRRAVASVAGQSLLPLELILVDDGSADGTLGELRDTQRALGEHWVKVIALDRNAGAGGARNAGWRAASGRYVAFLDADDTWHPRKIEIQYAFMEAHPEVALSGHCHRRLDDRDSVDAPLGRGGHRVMTRGMLLRANRFVTPSVMVRRDIPHRFQPGKRYMEDHLLWLQIACAGMQVARLHESLAFLYKAPVGEAGLSAQTWAMRKAELANFCALRRSGHLGLAATVALCAYSLAKHVARSALLVARRTRRVSA